MFATAYEIAWNPEPLSPLVHDTQTHWLTLETMLLNKLIVAATNWFPNRHGGTPLSLDGLVHGYNWFYSGILRTI